MPSEAEMGHDADKDEKRIESEIEVARRDLEMDIEKREHEAKERLDDILSEKKMEFCSRCGRKIGSRTDWAGKCLWSDCEKLVCRECWDVKQLRFCRSHSRDVYGKSEEQAKKREFFREDDGDIKVDLRAMLDEDTESRKSKLQYYASEYARWLQKRLGEKGPIDWTPTGFLKKPQVKTEKQEGDSVTTISVKSWFRKKAKLSVVVTPFDAGAEFDLNSLTAMLHRMSRKYKGYDLFVLVSDAAKLDLVNSVNRLTDTAFSLYMVEPRKGHLYYNIKDPVTSGYSDWFNQKKEPRGFKARLKRLADLVSGRMVVTEKAVVNDFGFREKDVHGILRSCHFLAHIGSTDTFYWKED